MFDGVFSWLNVVDPFVVAKDLKENFVFKHFGVFQINDFIIRWLLFHKYDRLMTCDSRCKRKSNLKHFGFLL